METVLITGGSGLLGSALCKSLTAKGYRVIILGRTIPATAAPGNTSYAKWDIQKKQIDLAALQQADYIVHLAGAGVMDKKWTTSYKKEIIDSRTKSSELLIEKLKTSPNKVKALVSASAIGWYSPDIDAEQAPAHTEDDPADDSFLGNTCRLWEESVAPVTTLGKRLVKLRIGIVLSRDGGALTEFAKPLNMGVAAVLGNGKQVISWIHIQDLCRMFIAAIENTAMTGAYNAVAPAPVSNKTLIQTLKKIKGGFSLLLPVPAFILKLMLGGRSVEILKSNTVSSKKMEATGFDFLYPTIETALSALYNKSAP